MLLVLGALTEQAAAQALTATLTASDYNGYHISCFGAMDGSLTVNVSGGTAPYTYSWTTGATSATITDLAAGYYKVSVTDAANAEFIVDITLVEPLELKLSAEAFKYPSGKNISCWNCFNGSIAVDVDYGVPPYSYLWDDGPTTEDRSALGVGTYKLTVTDVNGCQLASGGIYLEEPAREDWTMNGNAGTNPATQYIGTSDNTDLVFRSNGQEGLRLLPNGALKIFGSATGRGPLYRDADGTLRIGGPPGTTLPPLPPGLCADELIGEPYWQVGGNHFSTPLCPEVEALPTLGTKQALPLQLITNDLSRVHIAADGKVGIGASAALGAKLHVQGDLLVRGGSSGDIITSSSTTVGAAIWARNNSAAWGLSISPDGKGHILGDWNNPTPHLSFSYDRIELATRLTIGNVPMRDGYRLFVQEGVLAEKVKVAVHTTDDWSDHVLRPGYRLMTLPEVAHFIRENGHLPGVPSAMEVVNNGLDLAKSDAVLLAKIEELMLHVIVLQERIVELEKARKP